MGAFDGLGTVLAALRERAGLTQREAADASGLSQKTIAGYERERIRPSIDALERLLPVYGIQTFGQLAAAATADHIGEPVVIYEPGVLAAKDAEIDRLRVELDEANRAVRRAVLGTGMIGVGRDGE